MIDIADYLTGIGITPIGALLIVLSVWASSQYFKYKIEKIRSEDKQVLDFLQERLKKRADALEELNALIHDFDHYINHVFEGDKGWYETETEVRFKEIRATSRERIEIIEDDFPEFLDLIYDYTDEGRRVGTDKFEYTAYKSKKAELESLFASIRATLPGMRNRSLTH